MTYASRATVQRHPVHHPGDLTHASLERKFRIAWTGEIGITGADLLVFDATSERGLGKFRRRAKPEVIDEADWDRSLKQPISLGHMLGRITCMV